MDSSRAGRDTYISCPTSEVRKLKPRKVTGLSQGMSQVCSLFGGSGCGFTISLYKWGYDPGRLLRLLCFS